MVDWSGFVVEEAITGEVMVTEGIMVMCFKGAKMHW